MPLKTISSACSQFLAYTRLTLSVLAGPAVFSIYVIALWSLTANLGLSASFPWSTGPLSNFVVWLALTLMCTAALIFAGRRTEFSSTSMRRVDASEKH
jgi:hypothetical protein